VAVITVFRAGGHHPFRQNAPEAVQNCLNWYKLQNKARTADF